MAVAVAAIEDVEEGMVRNEREGGRGVRKKKRNRGEKKRKERNKKELKEIIVLRKLGTVVKHRQG